MTQKTMARNDRGEPTKTPGWFSWRHADNEAHVAANEGRSRRETKERKRTEAEGRDAALPADSPKRRRNRGFEVSA